MSSAGTAQPSGVAAFLSGIQTPTVTSSTAQYPEWLTQALMGLTNAAGSVAQQPYNPFPGPTVAAPSAQTLQAQQLAGQNVGSWQPALNQAQALTQAGSAPITSGDVSTFLNPYQNYVTGALNTNLQQNILPGIQDKFVGAGQSRSPQEAQVTGQAVYGTQQAAGQALAGGYQGALNSLQQERQQQLGAGAQLGQLGALGSQLGTADVGSLAAAGSAQDQYAQQNINSALNQFQQQQQYPYQQLGFLSDILNRVPQGAPQAKTTAVTDYSNPASSPLETFAGSLLGGKAVGLASGGRVPARGALAMMRMAA